MPLLAACVLTACSGSPGTAGTAEPARELPLEQYFDSVYGGGLGEEEREKQLAERVERSEGIVAQCMKEQGFEYTPNTTATEGGDSSEAWDLDSRKWVSQYGYGVVEQPGQAEAETGSAAEEDPNAAYVASLPESEQAAYREALAGPEPTEEEQAALESGEGEWNWEDAGCSGKAAHESMGEFPLESDEYEGLNDAITKFFEDQATWPELAELDASWSTCMAEAGHPGFTAQQDAQMSVWNEQGELQGADGPDGEPDPAALEALGKKEVELALADLDCRQRTDYKSKFEDVSFEKQQQFVDDHRTELEALKADAERGR
ncbi:hypothetical protein [Kineococcus sp. NUM-3379]